MTTINQLSAYDNPQAGDQLPIYSTGGRVENFSLQCISQADESDYYEVWIENLSDNDNATVSFLNMIITPVT